MLDNSHTHIHTRETGSQTALHCSALPCDEKHFLHTVGFCAFNTIWICRNPYWLYLSFLFKRIKLRMDRLALIHLQLSSAERRPSRTYLQFPKLCSNFKFTLHQHQDLNESSIKTKKWDQKCVFHIAPTKRTTSVVFLHTQSTVMISCRTAVLDFTVRLCK